MISILLISYGPSLYTLKGVRRTISAIAPNYVMGQYSSFALVFNFSQAYGWIANELQFRDITGTGQEKEYIDGFYSASDLFGIGYGQRFFELAIMGSYHFDAWDKNNPNIDRLYPDNSPPPTDGEICTLRVSSFSQYTLKTSPSPSELRDSTLPRGSQT
jgi:hypothetical protein